ncbi:MAG TPA: hypothetical protein VMZ06_16145 [Candidatus Bathyarchaeia archaeon]|nr:hypothetical protein [Candidatus Bathyarchaeia archaeon]
MAKKPTKPTDFRVVSMEVKGVAGEWSEVTGRWHRIAKQLQQLTNHWWEIWLVWHAGNESAAKIRAWLDHREKIKQEHVDDAKGCKAALKKFGFCPVPFWPPDLAKGRNGTYQTLSRAYPELTKGVIVLAMNRLFKTLKSRKAASGPLPGWVAIVLRNEAVPSFTNPMPIPFDVANTGTDFIPPVERTGNWRVLLSLSRTEDERGRGHSKPDTVELYCQGRKVAGEAAKLKHLASGEWAFKGSYLVYSRKRRKWFLQLAYDQPAGAKPELDAARVAVLRAGDEWPWELALPDDGLRHPGGRGSYIAPKRKSLLLQRWNRRANYRNAGHANKGHGRTRAGAGPQWRLQQAWKDFTKRVNHAISREVVDACVCNGCGTLRYEQPVGEFGQTRFLHNAGKVEGREDSTGWPWFQLKTFLEQKCHRAGITLVVVTADKCEGSGDAENPGTARDDATPCAANSCDQNGRGQRKKQGTNTGEKQDRSRKSPQSTTA